MHTAKLPNFSAIRYFFIVTQYYYKQYTSSASFVWCALFGTFLVRNPPKLASPSKSAAVLMSASVLIMGIHKPVLYLTKSAHGQCTAQLK